MNNLITLPNAINKQRNVLPKTGQTVSYQAAYDGDCEAGWWRKRLNVNNKTRFVAKTIGGVNVICDYATRLMWCKDPEAGTYTWTLALSEVAVINAAARAGFSDWKLPNVLEMESIVDFEKLPPPNAIYLIFAYAGTAYFWTSTTLSTLLTIAWRFYSASGALSSTAKTTNTLSMWVCRDF